MAFDKSDLKKIAQLARLHLDENEIGEVTNSISNILNLIDDMQSVQTDDIVPLAHPLDAVQRLREDHVTEVNCREILQANAPSTEKGLYLVPKVLE